MVMIDFACADICFDLPLYTAIQDEIWRLNSFIHRSHTNPTIYRQGKSYAIERAFFESDIVWFYCYELILALPYLHIRVPFLKSCVHHCTSENEWAHLLLESNVARHVYFNGYHEVTGKLVSNPLTNRT